MHFTLKKIQIQNSDFDKSLCVYNRQYIYNRLYIDQFYYPLFLKK